ncbi:MAG: disulfide bond formation protein B [Ilumatobacteraceae bacterium]
MVETIETLTSVLALVAAVGAIALVVVKAAAGSVPAAARAGAAVTAWRAPLTLAVAGVSMIGSLYFSESAHFVPCRLCWFQRIAMYPIAVIALVALVRRDRSARWYVVPLASIGIAVSTYHYLIERGVLHDSESCTLFGPSCADVWFTRFGFVTLAFMALAGFAAIIVLNTLSFDPPPSDRPPPVQEDL